MRRIGLAVVLGLVLLPFASEAQPGGKSYHVGFVTLGAHPTQSGLWQKLLKAMRELNYVEGQNLTVRLAVAEGKPERLPGLVAELVQAKVDVIVTTSTQETLAAQKATSTIPIVMTLVPDPVEQGLVASLARPGNNVTGLTTMAPGKSQKLVELLREAVPSASRFGVLRTGNSPFPEIRRELEVAAQRTGITLSYVEGIKGPDDFDPVLARAKKEGAGGIIAHTGTGRDWCRRPSNIGCPGSTGSGISWKTVVSCRMALASTTWADAAHTSLTDY